MQLRKLSDDSSHLLAPKKTRVETRSENQKLSFNGEKFLQVLPLKAVLGQVKPEASRVIGPREADFVLID